MALLTDVDDNIDYDEIPLRSFDPQDVEGTARWITETSIVLQRMLAKLKVLSAGLNTDAINAGLVNNVFSMIWYPELKYYDVDSDTEADFAAYSSHGIISVIQDDNLGFKFLKVEGSVAFLDDPFLVEDGTPENNDHGTGSYCFIALPTAASLALYQYFTGKLSAMFVEPTTLGDSVFNFLTGVIGVDGIKNKRARLFYSYSDTGVNYVKGILPSFFEAESSFAFDLMFPITEEGFNELVAFYRASYEDTQAGGLIQVTGTETFVVRALQRYGQTYINALVQMGGKLFAGTGDEGNLFRLADITNIPSSLLRLSGSTFTEICAQVENQNKITALVPLNGKLYAAAGTSGVLLEYDAAAIDHPSLLEFDGIGTFTTVANRLNNQNKITAFVELSATLYAAGGTSGTLLEFDEVNMAWTQVAPQSGTTTQINGMAVLSGEIYGISNTGSLLKWNGTTAWSSAAAAIPTYTEGFGLVEFGGVLYGLLRTPSSDQCFLYKLSGGAWSSTNVSNPGVTSDILKYLVVASGRLFGLYTGTAYNTILREYVGTDTYTARSTGETTNAQGMVYFDSSMWVWWADGTFKSVGINGTVSSTWTTEAALTGYTPRSAYVFGGELYVGTEEGILFKYDGVSAFNAVVTANTTDNVITALIDFGSSLYAGLSAS